MARRGEKAGAGFICSSNLWRRHTRFLEVEVWWQSQWDLESARHDEDPAVHQGGAVAVVRPPQGHVSWFQCSRMSVHGVIMCSKTSTKEDYS